MIERQGNTTHVVYCDYCSHYSEYVTDGDFNDLLTQMRGDGWTSKKVGGEWMNRCPACSG